MTQEEIKELKQWAKDFTGDEPFERHFGSIKWEERERMRKALLRKLNKMKAR